jgi:hypothetical protein
MSRKEREMMVEEREGKGERGVDNRNREVEKRSYFYF